MPPPVFSLPRAQPLRQVSPACYGGGTKMRLQVREPSLLLFQGEQAPGTALGWQSPKCPLPTQAPTHPWASAALPGARGGPVTI